jgi:hypothetical protein
VIPSPVDAEQWNAEARRLARARGASIAAQDEIVDARREARARRRSARAPPALAALERAVAVVSKPGGALNSALASFSG